MSGEIMESMGGRGSFSGEFALINHKTFMKTNRFTCFITQTLRKFLFQDIFNYFFIFFILGV